MTFLDRLALPPRLQWTALTVVVLAASAVGASAFALITGLQASGDVKEVRREIRTIERRVIRVEKQRRVVVRRQAARRRAAAARRRETVRRSVSLGGIVKVPSGRGGGRGPQGTGLPRGRPPGRAAPPVRTNPGRGNPGRSNGGPGTRGQGHGRGGSKGGNRGQGHPQRQLRSSPTKPGKGHGKGGSKK